MQFTLDSVENFKACLQEIHLGKEVRYTPCLITDLSELKQETPDTYYFGLITNGHTNNTCEVKFGENVNIVIEANSQIIEGFTHLDFYDSEAEPIAEPLGMFRGYEISIR